jgi:hypothetical protein
MKLIAALLMSLLLSGCVSYAPTKPEGYKGALSFIQDSKQYHDTGKADMFYLQSINGKEIYHSRAFALEESYGKGNYLHSVDLIHEVPSENAKFTLVGRTVYAMPIRAIAGTVYEIKTDIEFTPAPNTKYVVKGRLAEDFSEIWIESVSDPSEVIGKYREGGSTALGILSK